MTPAVTASEVPPTRPDLNAIALVAAFALGIGAFFGAVACTIQLIARI